MTAPDTDPATLALGEPFDFTAEATLDGKPLEPTALTWAWDFGDKSEVAKENPAPHAYTAPGEYLVTVTALYEKLTANAKVTVIVEAGGAKDYPTGPGTIIFVPNVGGSTCDGCQVHCAVPCSELYPNTNKTYVGARFWATIRGVRQRMDAAGPDGWVSVSPEHFLVGTPPNQTCYRVSTYGWLSQGSWNQSVPWEVEYGILTFPGGTDTYSAQASITPNNSVVTSATPPLIFHTTNPQSHPISWNVGHLNHPTNPPLVFTVKVTVYDLSGGVVWTAPLIYQGPGNGAVTWPGTRTGMPPNGGQPAQPGIYTFKVEVVKHNGPQPCMDQDKSGQLLLWVYKMCYLELDPQAQRFRFKLRYKVSRAAASVTIRMFKRDLTAGPTTGGPATQGLNWSPEILLTGSDWFENGALKQPIYCVVEATEDAATAAQNRDQLAKHALPKGTTTVALFPVTKIRDLTYQNGHTVVQDGTSSPYVTPHWSDYSSPLDGDADDVNDRKYPYCYVRNTNMNLTAIVQVDPNSIPNPSTVRIRGTGPNNMSIPSSPALVNGNTATITNVAATGAFPNYVHRYDALHIDWELSVDGGSTWEDVGTTENEVFVTLGAPRGSRYRTMLYRATAHGGPGITTEATAAECVWDSFEGLDVQAWNDLARCYGTALHYYKTGGPTSPGSIDNLFTAPDYEGDCNAWADLLLHCFMAHRIGGALGVGIDHIVVSPPERYGTLTVKLDQGQNTSPPGQDTFPQHAIVYCEDLTVPYLDPSYGLRAVGRQDYTAAAIWYYNQPEGPWSPEYEPNPLSPDDWVLFSDPWFW